VGDLWVGEVGRGMCYFYWWRIFFVWIQELFDELMGKI